MCVEDPFLQIRSHIGVRLWDNTNAPRMMSISYYDKGFKIMPALIGISKEFDISGMETLHLDHFFVLFIHSSGEWFDKCLLKGITKNLLHE